MVVVRTAAADAGGDALLPLALLTLVATRAALRHRWCDGVGGDRHIRQASGKERLRLRRKNSGRGRCGTTMVVGLHSHGGHWCADAAVVAIVAARNVFCCGGIAAIVVSSCAGANSGGGGEVVNVLVEIVVGAVVVLHVVLVEVRRHRRCNMRGRRRLLLHFLFKATHAIGGDIGGVSDGLRLRDNRIGRSKQLCRTHCRRRRRCITAHTSANCHQLRNARHVSGAALRLV